LKRCAIERIVSGSLILPSRTPIGIDEQMTLASFHAFAAVTALPPPF
jgi:hypothetical protein